MPGQASILPVSSTTGRHPPRDRNFASCAYLPAMLRLPPAQHPPQQIPRQSGLRIPAHYLWNVWRREGRDESQAQASYPTCVGPPCLPCFVHLRQYRVKNTIRRTATPIIRSSTYRNGMKPAQGDDADAVFERSASRSPKEKASPARLPQSAERGRLEGHMPRG